MRNQSVINSLVFAIVSFVTMSAFAQDLHVAKEDVKPTQERIFTIRGRPLSTERLFRRHTFTYIMVHRCGHGRGKIRAG